MTSDRAGAVSKIEVRFEPSGRTARVAPGTSLMAAAHRARASIPSSCGGYGTCGECKVRVIEGMVSTSEEDREMLPSSEVEDGWRLACQAELAGNARCLVPEPAPQPSAAVEGMGRDIGISEKKSEATAKKEPGSAAIEAKPAHLGLAFDLGTTTVAAVLVDLSNGRVLTAGSDLNRQASRGADVISRAAYAHSGPDRLAELQSLALDTLNALVGRLCQEAGVAPDAVYEAVVTGNAIMLHLLLRVDPHPLAIAPFQPAFTEAQDLPASVLQLPDAVGISSTGLDRAGAGPVRSRTDPGHLPPRTSGPSPILAINPGGRVVTFPVISAYAGGDTVAGIHATQLLDGAGPALLIDIGTNTEVALAWDGHLVTASAPAGPAFEGAGIRRGSAAVPGAITHVRLENGREPEIEVIGGGKPTGICGSGLIDLLAEIRKTCLLDRTGRLTSPEDVSGTLDAARIEVVDGHPAFRVVEDLHLEQKDIRELQAAIAAVAAACRIVLDHAGVEATELARVLLAGSFGASLDAGNAIAVGLVPSVREGIVHAVGNAAMEGAKAALVSGDLRKDAFGIPSQAEYLELSGHPGFNDAFLEAMAFPELSD